MLSHSNVVITGGTFTQVGSGRSDSIDRLMAASAPNALHDSSARFDPPKCHPKTRLAVLERIMQWIFGSDDPQALILWLYGPAGAGKSAILQSIAEKCAAFQILLASFFFSRTDGTRNHPAPFIATLAYQISTRIPVIASAVESAISRDPMIFKKSLDTQIKHLIVNPLQDLVREGYFADKKAAPRVILVDGIDECNGQDHRRHVLLAIAKALRDHRLPLIFLVASRPEEDITLTFNSKPMKGLWSSLVLDNSFSPDKDILLFLEESFQEIKDTHPRRSKLPPSWPSDEAIFDLVCKSSGQFIYASIVIKFISAIFDMPHRRLEIVLGLRPPRHDLPFAELDALYMYILSSAPRSEDVQSILAAMVSINLAGSQEIESLLELEEGDVELAVSPLSSIIHISQDWRFKESNVAIYLTHASFSDFIVDKSRSGEFHIDIATYQTEFIHRICKHLDVDDDDSVLEATLFELPLLGEILDSESAPITDTIVHLLQELPLDTVWTSFSRFGVIRTQMVFQYLDKISILASIRKDDSIINYGDLLSGYLSRMASVLHQEAAKYFSSPTLVACLILYMAMHFSPVLLERQDPFLLFTLLQVDEDVLDLDQSSLAIMNNIMTFPGVLKEIIKNPIIMQNLAFRADDYNQTALQVLAYLCEHHQACHHAQQRKHLPKRRSPLGRGITNKQDTFRISGGSDSPSLARRLRADFHQRGREVILCQRHYPETIYLLATRILPAVFRECSRSEDLKSYIRTHIRSIAVVPLMTRRALSSIADYLEYN